MNMGSIMKSTAVNKMNLLVPLMAFLFLILCGAYGMLLYAAPAQATTGKQASSPAKLPRVVDVGADKCVPCIMMAPEIEKLKKEYAGALEVEFVDVWKRPQDADSYKVRSIPTQIFYDASGKELARHVGFISKEDILDKFKELGIPIKKKSGK
jgi:thioredoxin 1